MRRRFKRGFKRKYSKRGKKSKRRRRIQSYGSSRGGIRL